jgi:hypothetical protein
MFYRLRVRGAAPHRRIATRYDKLAANFLSAVYLAATIGYWVRGLTCNALRTPVMPLPLFLSAWQPAPRRRPIALNRSVCIDGPGIARSWRGIVMHYPEGVSACGGASGDAPRSRAHDD